MANDTSSMDCPKVYEEVIVSGIPPAHLHGVIGIRLWSQSKGNVVKSRFIAQVCNSPSLRPE
eukprot:3785180-Lingulodinium_polyedra.AAC.1